MKDTFELSVVKLMCLSAHQSALIICYLNVDPGVPLVNRTSLSYMLSSIQAELCVCHEDLLLCV